MRKITGFCALLFCAWTLSATAQERSGSWTMMPAEEAGQVRFAIFQRHERGTSHSESDWPVSAFEGLDLATRARHDVTFAIVRDAGRFDGEGYLEEREGAGVYRFTPDPGFARAMG